MKKYKLLIETLTPIHIGNGNVISGMDYYCLQDKLDHPFEKSDDGQDIKYQSFLYKFKIYDYMDLLDAKDKGDLLSKLKSNDTLGIRNQIFSQLHNKKELQKSFIGIAKSKIPISNTFYKLWMEKIVGKRKKFQGKTMEKRENEFENQLSQLVLNEFINSLGRFYIPGSSLKGAIRTFLTNENCERLDDATKDPFKKLIVRDSNFVRDGLEIGKLARRSQEGDGVYVEFLKAGTKFETEIVIRDFLDDHNSSGKIDFSKQNICLSANNYVGKKIQQYVIELAQIKNHSELKDNNTKTKNKQQKFDSVIKSFQNILDVLNTLHQDECIVNIGFGGGYWFKLLDMQEERHPNKGKIGHLIDNNINIPRTNCQIDLENMGFVKLIFIDSQH